MCWSGSEPKFEPDFWWTWPRSSPRFGVLAEPDLRSSSRFSNLEVLENWFRTGLNWTFLVKKNSIRIVCRKKIQPPSWLHLINLCDLTQPQASIQSSIAYDPTTIILRCHRTYITSLLFFKQPYGKKVQFQFSEFPKWCTKLTISFIDVTWTLQLLNSRHHSFTICSIYIFALSQDLTGLIFLKHPYEKSGTVYRFSEFPEQCNNWPYGS